jgi:UDP-N-acetylmuramoylalanine--D-glutamate ligase
MAAIDEPRRTTTRELPARPADVVLGLGPTGLACARFLRRRGRSVMVMDSRESPPGLRSLRSELPEVPVITGGFDVSMMRRAQRLVLSPGVSPDVPEVRAAAAQGVEVLGEIELFARVVNAPLAAVTGSNGKSTVTEMLAQMLREAGVDAAVGGNLGINALDLLRTPPPTVYLLELSSFQLETTHSLRSEVACVLNLSPDHMDRHGDLATYAAAKARIFDGARHAVVNLDDAAVMAMAPAAPAPLGFSVRGVAGAQAWLRGEDDDAELVVHGEPLMRAAEVPLAGRHNLANVLAASLMAARFDVPAAAMRKAMLSFRGLPHRCQTVAERDGVTWVNDSKGTNVGAAVAAIEGLQHGRNLVLIAGGEGKQQDFAPLGMAAQQHVHTVLLLGRDAGRIAEALPAEVVVARAGDLLEAVELARDVAHAGDCVLFSPACASFDMFDDYVARGEAFVDLVNRVLTP